MIYVIPALIVLELLSHEIMNISAFTVLVINLDRRADKLAICDYQLKNLSMSNYTRISGVDGKLLWEELQAKPNASIAEVVGDSSLLASREFIVESGKMHAGCTLSHLKALKFIIDHNIQGPVLILEDDFAADGDALRKTERFLKMFPSDWDLFYAGHCQAPMKCEQYVTKDYVACQLANEEVSCAHAYVVNGAKSAQKLYNAGNTPKLALADFFAQKAQAKRFIIYPYLFSQLRQVEADVQSEGGAWYRLRDDSLVKKVVNKFLH